jgi:hypothetical protein
VLTVLDELRDLGPQRTQRSQCLSDLLSHDRLQALLPNVVAAQGREDICTEQQIIRVYCEGNGLDHG